jgi:hypothetical protein
MKKSNHHPKTLKNNNFKLKKIKNHKTLFHLEKQAAES